MSGRMGIVLKNVMKKKEVLYFMLPGLLLVILITFFPIIDSVQFSFYRTYYLELKEFIGLKNYAYFLNNPSSLRSINASLVYVLGTVILSLTLGFLLALVFNRNIRFRGVFRTIAIIPWIISQIVTALLFKWLLDPVYGPVAYYTSLVSDIQFSYLSNKYTAMLILILVNVWRSYPLAMVLILAALQTVPKELYESATIDGASGIKAFFHITLPLSQSTLLVTAILLTINTLNMVTLIYMLTGGSPFGFTEVLSLRLLKEAFHFWNLGMACTIGVIMFILNVLFGIIYIRILHRETIY
ncbi:MAG: sugar ABC transporter permease [Atribacterota bacterium]|nr:sugar ABC transporter permease [Atribacterota bacterium]